MTNYLLFLSLLLSSVSLLPAQTTTIWDDFEGNGSITTWLGDDCNIQTDFANPFAQDLNPSATVLAYHDVGGPYANVRFEVAEPFDLNIGHLFSLKIYVPANGLTGNQALQVSLKLQDGTLDQPWVTQSEIIKPIVADQWQTVTFDFAVDAYRNLDASSPPPIQRTDFNRVVIQLNGENNTDQVRAYLDDISYAARQLPPSIYNQLVWSDEFDTDGPLDTSKWFAQSIIPNGESWFNGEIQHYTARPDNARVSDGKLHLIALRETYTAQGQTKDFTSARLNSKFAFTYGRVEVRAKLPEGAGTWPAIWMLGKNINERGAYWQTQGFGTTSWPACGEIDIMEHWGTNQDYISSAIHTPSSYGATENYGGRLLPGASTDFHVYAVEWSPEKIDFSVDGVVHYTYAPAEKNADTWPFTAEQYLILNIAILPHIAPEFSSSTMEVDYVRVYQQGSVATNELTLNSPLHCYPNPFTSDLHIAVPGTTATTINLQVFSAEGKLVRTSSAAVHGQELVLQNLDTLKPACYVVRFELDGRRYSLKVLKQ
ncbi:MAG: glycosyl hydrolase family protein [Bacteroidetes bacterium]|nr:MAG: glycosyl hydrolase family protein [Bacteroidota bacterium]